MIELWDGLRQVLRARWNRLVILTRARILTFLQVATTSAIAKVIAEEAHDRREDVRLLHESMLDLTRQVCILSDTVKMMALWHAKHDVEALEKRGTVETHTSGK